MGLVVRWLRRGRLRGDLSFRHHIADFPGLDFVRQVVAETSLPAFVLGGVTLENLPEVVAAGAQRVAVSQAICGAENPRQVAARMRTMLDV